ncbi:MAG: hypothetical protein Fur005_22830 [Roseiflexaceae bacterium]
MRGTTLISTSKQTIQFVDGLCVTRTHERFTVGTMDSAIIQAMQAPHLPGFYDVIVHGNYDGMHFVVMAHQSSNTLHDANQLVRLIQAQPDYQPNQPVRLLICWAGKHEHGLAAQVAAQLNCAVLAATKEIVVGNPPDEPPFWLYEGEWRLFQPTGGSQPFDC